MQPNRYNVRVYGVWINEQSEVLLTDERRNGFDMTKFPGGGHEFGEGLREGLEREWREELNIGIAVGELLYINDFLQVSAFNPKDQLLSVYYYVEGNARASFPVTNKKLDFPLDSRNAQTFRWVALSTLRAEEFTFPVDKVVAKMLAKVPG